MMQGAVQGIVSATGRTEEEARQACLRSTPHGRPSSPDEVAEVAVLLATNPAITGQAVHVDGGESMA